MICGVIAFLILILFGRQLTATSLKGARTRVQILGFQEFMNRVDADRLKRMPPDTFEKFLPYAMALGVEHRWAKAFEGIIQNPPTWYSGDWTTFNTFYFVNSLGSMSQQATSTFVSAPRAAVPPVLAAAAVLAEAASLAAALAAAVLVAGSRSTAVYASPDFCKRGVHFPHPS